MSDNVGITGKYAQPQISTEGTVETAETTVAKTSEQKVANNSAALDDAIDESNYMPEAFEPTDSSVKTENKKTPVKRTPSKRMSYIERAQKESEELIKNLGGSLELEGGRRTRSSTRGTPTRNSAAFTPPPAKKSRATPGSAESSGGSRGRGRGRKIEISEFEADEAQKEMTPEKPKRADESIVENNDATKYEREAACDQPQTAIINSNIVSDTSLAADGGMVQMSGEKQNDSGYDIQVSQNQEKSSKTDSSMGSEVLCGPVPVQAAKEIVVIKETDHESSDTKKAAIAESSRASETITSVAVEVPVVLEVQGNSQQVFETPGGRENEPTPEPMEVDSNSNSNDDMGEQIGTTARNKQGNLTSDNTTRAPLGNNPVLEQALIPTAGVGKCDIEEPKNVMDSFEKSVEINCSTEQVPPAADSLTGTLETKTSALKAAIVVNDSINVDVATNNEANKPENDLCQPKVVSPSINTANSDGPITTPHYCN